jgi:hypothetical protein
VLVNLADHHKCSPSRPVDAERKVLSRPWASSPTTPTATAEVETLAEPHGLASGHG